MAEVEDDDMLLKSSLCVSEDVGKIMEMIEQLKILVDNASTVEKAYENFWEMLSNFQEQSHLLDGHLDVILSELVDVVMNPKSSNIKNEAFKYLHTVMKVRGYKRAVRYMSHEVKDFTIFTSVFF
ncbi:hypothetical protein PR048_012968 [Dryococelus australis]|uniref:Uncharacterized protein n=1 Tax=Dryococelus australis TaxID=614101 RepID=A0ABQ9HQV7_9NEOP|nr:hypothetical protein PR048_012968 [Dryococelus australis]